MISGFVNSVKTNAGNKMGKKIRIAGKEVQEEKLISEGGYAYVFKVVDCNTGEIYAMKKMICQNQKRLKTAQNEINVLKTIPNHPNIMQYYGSEIQRTDDGWIAYLLIEFCDGGSVFDLMQKYEHSKLQEKQILFVLREVCEGVKVMHSLNPPIAHRDIKIENVLLHNKAFKLCDFGSCSTDQIDLAKIPKSRYFNIEEEFDKNTTLMYRPPEMCDLYQQYPISEKADVWMVGCMLFTMCYYKHPFAEMSKLAIVNASFNLPDEPHYPEKLKDLARLMLTPNPRLRPNIFDIIKILDNYDSITHIKLNQQAIDIKGREQKQQSELKKFEAVPQKKFQGDIPLDELQKLRDKIKRSQQNNPDQGLQSWGGGNDDDDYDDPSASISSNFKQQNEKETNAFSSFNASSVKVTQQSSNEWGDWQNAKPQNSDNAFANFGFSGNSNNNNNNNSSNKNQPAAQNDIFSGFSFNSQQVKAPQQPQQQQRQQQQQWQQPQEVNSVTRKPQNSNQNSNPWDGFNFDENASKQPANNFTNKGTWDAPSFSHNQSAPPKVTNNANDSQFQEFFSAPGDRSISNPASRSPVNTTNNANSGWGDWGTQSNNNNNNNSNNTYQAKFNSTGNQAPPKQPTTQTVDLLDLADAHIPKENVDLSKISFF